MATRSIFHSPNELILFHSLNLEDQQNILLCSDNGPYCSTSMRRFAKKCLQSSLWYNIQRQAVLDTANTKQAEGHSSKRLRRFCSNNNSIPLGLMLQNVFISQFTDCTAHTILILNPPLYP